MAIELTTAPVETAIDAADELYFNDVSETPDALNRITYANFNGANLAAIKGLTSAADKGIQFTGAGTAAVFDLTAAGKALLDDADATAQRATLGLVIGTNVQAFDTDLTAIAALTSAANKLPYATGAGTWALTDLSVFGRSIIDDADEAAFKATVNLEIGTDVQAWDVFLDDIAALTDPGADRLMFWDDSAGEIVWLTLGTNLSITATTINAAGGGGIDGSGSAGVLAGWVDADTLEAVAGLTSPSGHALMIQAQASGDVGLSVRGNTSDDDNIFELRRGVNDAIAVSWNMYGDQTVIDRIVTYQASAETRGGWHSTQGGWMVCPTYRYNFTNANNFNTIDCAFERDAAGVIEINDGSTGGAALQFLEQTAPAAAVANGFRLYAVDNGSGKTQAMIIFASGSAQQIAIQP